jgi:hypothetical protein
LSNLTNKVTVMFKRLLRNRKGTAEVIGSVLFIVILLFFFTNVYLWHDAATKEMNDMYVQKLNSPIKATISHNTDDGSYSIEVTNIGGVDATLSNYWVNLKSASGPDTSHSSVPRSDIVAAGGPSVYIPINNYPPGTIVKVVTTVGNYASCSFPSP